jgi:hypothetical protein
MRPCFHSIRGFLGLSRQTEEVNFLVGEFLARNVGFTPDFPSILKQAQGSTRSELSGALSSRRFRGRLVNPLGISSLNVDQCLVERI